MTGILLYHQPQVLPWAQLNIAFWNAQSIVIIWSWKLFTLWCVLVFGMSFSSSLHVHNLLSALSPWRLISQFPSTVVAIQENLNTGFNLTHFKATNSSKAPTVVATQENQNTNLTRFKTTRSFKNLKVSIMVAVLESTNWVQLGSLELQGCQGFGLKSLVENKWWPGIALEWPWWRKLGNNQIVRKPPRFRWWGSNHSNEPLPWDLGPWLLQPSGSHRPPPGRPITHIQSNWHQRETSQTKRNERESIQLWFVLGIVQVDAECSLQPSLIFTCVPSSQDAI